MVIDECLNKIINADCVNSYYCLIAENSLISLF